MQGNERTSRRAQRRELRLPTRYRWEGQDEWHPDETIISESGLLDAGTHPVKLSSSRLLHSPAKQTVTSAAATRSGLGILVDQTMWNKITLGSIILFCSHALGQATTDGQDLATILSARYDNKMVCFRHFFRSNSQVYSREGKLLKKAPEGPWTYYGQMAVMKIDLADDAVHLEGNRVVYKFDEHAEHLIPALAQENIKVTIHLKSPAATLEEITATLGKVFVGTDDERLNSVPQEWRPYLARHPLVTQQGTQGSNATKLNPIFHFGERGITAPKLLSGPEPRHPEAAADFQGVVGLSAVVDQAGLVRDIKVVHPAGQGLDETAILGLKDWRFKPGTKDGIPVAVQLYIDVDFHFQN